LPQYFAKLARVLSAKDIPSFVQTVVFEMYGDQVIFRLLTSFAQRFALLSMIQGKSVCCSHYSRWCCKVSILISLKPKLITSLAGLEAAADQGSLLRANTAITQMLYAFASSFLAINIFATQLRLCSTRPRLECLESQ